MSVEFSFLLPTSVDPRLYAEDSPRGFTPRLHPEDSPQVLTSKISPEFRDYSGIFSRLSLCPVVAVCRLLFPTKVSVLFKPQLSRGAGSHRVLLLCPLHFRPARIPTLISFPHIPVPVFIPAGIPVLHPPCSSSPMSRAFVGAILVFFWCSLVPFLPFSWLMFLAHFWRFFGVLVMLFAFSWFLSFSSLLLLVWMFLGGAHTCMPVGLFFTFSTITNVCQHRPLKKSLKKSP